MASNLVSRLAARPRAARISPRALSLSSLSLAILSACLAGALPAAQAQVRPAAAAMQHDIPASSLEQALNRFAAAAGVLLATDSTLVAGRTSPGLSGRFSTQAGFDALLGGSGLEAVRQPDGSYTLRRSAVGLPAAATSSASARSAGQALPEVRVTEDAFRESAYGPATGFQARRASTATRTDAAIKDVPQSIQVVPRDVIDSQQAATVQDAVRNVSNVAYQNAYGATQTALAIRGVPASMYLIDGFLNYPGSSNPIETLGNIERIEVLKGPASVLYGQLEPGGVINLVRKQPTADPVRQVSFGAGSYGLFRGGLDLGGALSQDRQLTYRLNVNLERQDRTINGYDGPRNNAITGILAWRSAGTSLSAGFDYLDQRLPMDRGVLLGPKGEQVASPKFRFGEASDFVSNDRAALFVQLEQELASAWKFRQRLEYRRLDQVDRRFDIGNENAQPTARGDVALAYLGNDTLYKNWSGQTDLLGKLTTGSLQHDLLFTLDYGKSDREGGNQGSNLAFSQNVFQPFYGRPVPVRDGGFTDQSLTRRDWGVTAQDLVALSDQWKLLADLRFSDSRTTYHGPNFPVSVGRAWTPRVGIVYQPSKDTSFYASYAKGFSVNTYAREFSGKGIDPSRSTQKELGVKQDFLDGKLSATASVFHIVKTNVTAADPDHAGFNVATGEVTSKGAEFDIAGRLAPNWNLIASYGYTDAKVSRDSRLPPGTRYDLIPRSSASLWSDYSFTTPALQGFSIGAGLFYFDKRRINDTTAFAFDLPSQTQVNATIGYRQANWSLALTVNNLFDSTLYSSGRRHYFTVVPRTALLTAKVDF